MDIIADKVRIVEVSPRDGLQFEKKILSATQKIHFIDSLSNTGLTSIETTSFVNPGKISRLADAEQVYQGISKHTGVTYSALVPNEKGLQRAMTVGVKSISVFTAASEAFCHKNIGCSIEESIQRFEPVLDVTKQHDISVRGYISCIFACPYQGWIDIDAVVSVANKLYAMGCTEISLGDTIGIGTPMQCQELLRALAKTIPIEYIAVHFHDTRGQALANILVCLDNGVRIIDSSVAGLGGCPYAEGASGNVASEDVVYMLHGMGIHTGIDLEKLMAIGEDMSRLLHRNNESKLARAGLPDWLRK